MSTIQSRGTTAVNAVQERKPAGAAGCGETVQALARGLEVIRAFSAEHQRLTLSEVGRLTGLTRASARRCLLTLHELGYVAFDGKFFSLTPKILTLGYAYLSSTALPTVLQPALVHLSEKTGASSSGCIRDGQEVVIVARASANRYAGELGVGSRMPLYCTSLGLVLLAAESDEFLAGYLDGAELVEHTPFTPTQAADVSALVSRTRADGYALLSQGLRLDRHSVSVPVRNTSGQTVAAMSLTVPRQQASEEQLLGDYLPMLLNEAAILRQMLSP